MRSLFSWVARVAGGLAGAGLLSVAAMAAPPSDSAVAAAVAARLPKTKVTKVDCSKVNGVCEVQAGPNVFYVDSTARYLIVGRVYDMETRQDLTAARLLEINPDAMLAGAAGGNQGGGGTVAEGPDYANNAHAALRPGAGVAAPDKVSLVGLPSSGAIEWGGSGAKVTVFSDFHCGYCRLLHGVLRDMGVRVIERPISILGSRSISDAVLCSRDHVGAVEKAYNGEDVPAGKCDTSGLDANEKFARANGFEGTPVIVRADGSVLRGFRPKEFLEAWLKGGKN